MLQEYNLKKSKDPIMDSEFDTSMRKFNLNHSNFSIAVSGGPDSMALSILLSRYSKLNSIDLHALIVDHKIRDESSEEAILVSEKLNQLNIQNHILVWHEGIKYKSLSKSYQNEAREARLMLMSKWCKVNNIENLFMGHHADDQLETFIYRLIRGSGINGLSGISDDTRINNLRIIRPLLGFPKSRLLATCKYYNVSYVDDRSNQNKKFSRVRIRKLLHELEEEGLTKSRIYKTISHMNRAKLAIDNIVSDAINQFLFYNDNKTIAKIALSKFLNYPDEIGIRALSKMLSKISGKSYPPRFINLEKVYLMLKKANISDNDNLWYDRTLHGCKLIVQGEYLVISKENL